MVLIDKCMIIFKNSDMVFSVSQTNFADSLKSMTSHGRDVRGIWTMPRSFVHGQAQHYDHKQIN